MHRELWAGWTTYIIAEADKASLPAADCATRCGANAPGVADNCAGEGKQATVREYLASKLEKARLDSGVHIAAGVYEKSWHVLACRRCKGKYQKNAADRRVRGGT